MSFRSLCFCRGFAFRAVQCLPLPRPVRWFDLRQCVSLVSCDMFAVAGLPPVKIFYSADRGMSLKATNMVGYFVPRPKTSFIGMFMSPYVSGRQTRLTGSQHHIVTLLPVPFAHTNPHLRCIHRVGEAANRRPQNCRPLTQGWCVGRCTTGCQRVAAGCRNLPSACASLVIVAHCLLLPNRTPF
jgi:hypothetical protein